jgi:hypothetical protein
MRRDGAATFFLIQHQDSTDRWTESALDHFLFDGLPWRDERGDRYRELLHPQSASSDLWQKYSIHGFVELADAEAMLEAVRERHPERAFRIVRRTVTQHTEVWG